MYSFAQYRANYGTFPGWVFSFAYHTVDALIAFFAFALFDPAIQIPDQEITDAQLALSFLRRAYTNTIAITSLVLSGATAMCAALVGLVVGIVGAFFGKATDVLGDVSHISRYLREARVYALSWVATVFSMTVLGRAAYAFFGAAEGAGLTAVMAVPAVMSIALEVSGLLLLGRMLWEYPEYAARRSQISEIGKVMDAMSAMPVYDESFRDVTKELVESSIGVDTTVAATAVHNAQAFQINHEMQPYILDAKTMKITAWKNSISRIELAPAALQRALLRTLPQSVEEAHASVLKEMKELVASVQIAQLFSVTYGAVESGTLQPGLMHRVHDLEIAFQGGQKGASLMESGFYTSSALRRDSSPSLPMSIPELKGFSTQMGSERMGSQAAST